MRKYDPIDLASSDKKSSIYFRNLIDGMEKEYVLDVDIDFYIIWNQIGMAVNVADIILVNLQVHISDRQEHHLAISYTCFIYLH